MLGPPCLQKLIGKCLGEFRSKVLEGHHPRGSTLREALRGNLALRGLCGGLSEGSGGGSPRVLRGLSEGSAGFCGGPRGFPRFFGACDPMLVILGNCWSEIGFRQSNSKNLMGKFWGHLGVRLFYLPREHSEFRGEFRGKYRRTFRQLRSKFRVLLNRRAMFIIWVSVERNPQ